LSILKTAFTFIFIYFEGFLVAHRSAVTRFTKGLRPKSRGECLLPNVQIDHPLAINGLSRITKLATPLTA
jgi:hypothetical protein